MNQRIRELAEQAKEHANSYDDHGTPIWFQFYNEKFAELIVQECMLAVSKTPVSDDEVSIMVRCHNQIEKHFGVEND